MAVAGSVPVRLDAVRARIVSVICAWRKIAIADVVLALIRLPPAHSEGCECDCGNNEWHAILPAMEVGIKRVRIDTHQST